jgi:hypothetical protein
MVKKPVDLFEFLAERMIRKVEEQPITVEIQLADGSSSNQKNA